MFSPGVAASGLAVAALEPGFYGRVSGGRDFAYPGTFVDSQAIIGFYGKP